MRKLWKKPLSLLMILAMLISMLPMTAMAEGESAEDSESKSFTVCVGDQEMTITEDADGWTEAYYYYDEDKEDAGYIVEDNLPEGYEDVNYGYAMLYMDETNGLTLELNDVTIVGSKAIDFTDTDLTDTINALTIKLSGDSSIKAKKSSDLMEQYFYTYGIATNVDVNIIGNGFLTLQPNETNLSMGFIGVNISENCLTIGDGSDTPEVTIEIAEEQSFHSSTGVNAKSVTLNSGCLRVDFSKNKREEVNTLKGLSLMESLNLNDAELELNIPKGKAIGVQYTTDEITVDLPEIYVWTNEPDGEPKYNFDGNDYTYVSYMNDSYLYISKPEPMEIPFNACNIDGTLAGEFPNPYEGNYFEDEDVSEDQATKKIIAGTAIPAPTVKEQPTLDGYTFAGWVAAKNVAQDGEDPEFEEITDFKFGETTIIDEIVFFATWEKVDDTDNPGVDPDNPSNPSDPSDPITPGNPPVDPSNPGGGSSGSGGSGSSNKSKKGWVILTKVDAEDNDTVLEGVTFELYKENGDYVDEYITDDDGEIRVKLNKGDYYWVETKPAAGYILDEEEQEFTVRRNKTTEMTVENERSAVPEYFTQEHYAYVVGYDDGLVHPEWNITRAEVTSIFFRLLDADVRADYLTKENNFNDVNEGDWFNTAVSTMAAMGIVSGYDGNFYPAQKITRGEFAAMASRFEKNGNSSGGYFADIYDHWAMKEINIAANNGWVLGYEDGTFQPNQYITRAEAMAMVNRVLQRVPEYPDDLNNHMILWPDNMDAGKWYYLTVQEATNSHDYERKVNGYEYWTGLKAAPNWNAYL